jgi:hypothetical protein
MDRLQTRLLIPEAARSCCVSNAVFDPSSPQFPIVKQYCFSGGRAVMRAVGLQQVGLPYVSRGGTLLLSFLSSSSYHSPFPSLEFTSLKATFPANVYNAPPAAGDRP